MKIAFLFAGQGSQYVGMGKDLYEQYEQAKEVFDQVQFDFDLKEVCFEDTQGVLNETKYTQPAIYTVSLAIANVLRSKNIIADYCAGLSLGEYSALAYANVFDISQGAQIVSKRGTIMNDALPANTSGMSAVLNMDAKTIKSICDCVTHESKEIVQIANYNCPGQIVITGSTKGIALASEKLTQLKARIIPLKVSGAFHSSLLENASHQLLEVLNQYEFNKPTIPVVFNVSGNVEYEDITSLLKRQICSSVYFMQSIQNMIEQGVDTFIEIGPGKTLSGFVKKISKEVKVYNVQDVSSLKETMEALKDE